MDTQKFTEAQQYYNEGDFRKSARLFLDAVEKGTPIGNGPAYHMAGNSFLRLKRYSDATVVFEHALRDDTYNRRGAVEANLANAYVRTGDYDSAIAHYEAALASGDAENAYKYYQGTAQAYMQQEKYDLAAIAYKHAALEPNNPTPGKSLSNLGLAMMANGNGAGAVEAYQAAIACPEYENKGRALLNLGIAYHSLGMWEDAVKALEEAKHQPNYQGSELAEGTLEHAKRRIELEQGVAEADQKIEDEVVTTEDDDLIDPVEAYMQEQAEKAAAQQEQSAKDDIDTGDPTSDDVEAAATGKFPAITEDAVVDDDGILLTPHEADVGNSEDVERFFSMSEREVAAKGKEELKEERGKFFWVKWAAVIILLLGALGGGGAALFLTGQGHPSAESTVTNLLQSYSEGRSIAEYWTFGAQANIESRMVVVPIPETFTIDSVDSASMNTDITVTVHTEDEDARVFVFNLAREGIGWKVENIVPDNGGATTIDNGELDLGEEAPE